VVVCQEPNPIPLNLCPHQLGEIKSPLPASRSLANEPQDRHGVLGYWQTLRGPKRSAVAGMSVPFVHVLLAEQNDGRKVHVPKPIVNLGG